MIENQSRIEDYDKPLIGKPQAANAAKEKVTEILASYRLSDLTLVRLAPIIELSSAARTGLAGGASDGCVPAWVMGKVSSTDPTCK